MVMLTGKQIASLRIFLGLGRTQFAARVGVSDSTICNWELERTHPWHRHWLALQPIIDEAKAKGWTPSWSPQIDGDGAMVPAAVAG